MKASSDNYVINGSPPMSFHFFKNLFLGFSFVFFLKGSIGVCFLRVLGVVFFLNLI
jgi:hypothetical protein